MAQRHRAGLSGFAITEPEYLLMVRREKVK
jgi:hypothetical protein